MQDYFGRRIWHGHERHLLGCVARGATSSTRNKATNTHYVYVLTMNDEGKVEKMYKVWNAPWALKELG